MSKLVLFLTIPAVAGLVAWNVSLSSEIADLRSELAAKESTGADPARAPAKAAAPTGETRVRETARANPQVTELVERLAELEKRLPPAPAAGAAKPEATGAAPPVAVPSDVVTYFSSDAFKGAVTKVLDERDVQRRRERDERVVDARMRFLLRDLNVTDAQRAEVKRLLLASMEKIEQVRENESLGDDQRRQEMQALQQEQIESLAAVLDAQAMEQVRQRTSGGNLRRGGLAPGGGGRRNPGGQPPNDGGQPR
jgi:hypothetical protein